MIKKIISGGHPGAEKAALDAALKLDIPHGGWTYKGRKTEEGPLPEQYNVQEIIDKDFSKRIEKNVMDAAGTIIFCFGKPTLGLKMVEELASLYQRPCLNIDLNESPLNIAAATIRVWMAKNEVQVIYFTGQKPTKGSDIYSEVLSVIEAVHRMDTEDTESHSV